MFIINDPAQSLENTIVIKSQSGLASASLLVFFAGSPMELAFLIMAKRFTETGKWSDPWFRKLKPKFKCFWQYLCDNCDMAGVWNEDMEAATFHIGEKISHEEAVMALEGRVELFDYKGEAHWLLPAFIFYQYKEPKEDHNPHKPIFQSLTKYNLTLGQGLAKAWATLPREGFQDKDTDKDKDKDTDKDKGPDKGTVRGKPRSLLEVQKYCKERKNDVDHERWYSHYESNGWKVGKNAMKDWRAAVRTWEKNEFNAPNKPVDAGSAPNTAPCPKTIVEDGVRYVCLLRMHHEGDCDFEETIDASKMSLTDILNHPLSSK